METGGKGEEKYSSSFNKLPSLPSVVRPCIFLFPTAHPPPVLNTLLACSENPTSPLHFGVLNQMLANAGFRGEVALDQQAKGP